MTPSAEGSRYLIPAAIVVVVIAATYFLLYIAFFGVLLD